ncbi:hypothetical protein [Nostocoides australiense]
MGNKNWEEWWLREYGSSIPREGSYEEHLSFANFDLTNSNLPKLEKTDELGVATITVPSGADLSRLVEILRYHGFEFQQ